MAADLKTLKYKRGVVKGNITRLKTYFDTIKSNTDISEVELEQLSSRLQDAEPYYIDFNNIQESIDILSLSEDPPMGKTSEEHEEFVISQGSIERDNFEKTFREITAEIRVFICKQRTNGVSSGNSGSMQQSAMVSNVRFPKINLPTFSGHYHDWMEFHDIFQSLIHSNNSLDEVQKFYYLKSCLKGEAANVVKSLEVSANNYNVAWSLLNDRFENKRLITNNHIKSILEFNNITKESSTALRTLSDELNKHLRCLKALGHPVQHWDTLLIQIVLSKVDHVTRKEWEQVNFQGTYPTIEEFTLFLKKRCELLEAMQANSVNKTESREIKPFFHKFKREAGHTTSYYSSVEAICVFCKKAHLIYNCPEFLKLSISSRISEVKKLHLCWNCLRKNHHLKDCTAITCRKCNKKHHTLLHLEHNNATSTITNQSTSDSQPSEQISVSSEQNPSNSSVAYHSIDPKVSSQVILATVVLLVKSSNAEWLPCRAFLDCGSQSNFVSEDMCKKLNLKKEVCNSVIGGITEGLTNIKFKVNLEIRSMHNNYSSNLSCLVLKQITEYLPSFSFDSSSLRVPDNIRLADPNFHTSGKIDLLLGASLFWEILCAGQIRFGEGMPILHKTLFGWVLSGQYSFQAQSSKSKQPKTVLSYHSLENSQIESALSKFWELEEIDYPKHMSREDILVESYFSESVKRDNDGRFIVSIPFRKSVTDLGESRSLAVKRLQGLEKKLSANPNLKTEYEHFLREYEQLGHMSRIEEHPIPAESCYIPHHCVLKEASTTTKVRVVFDASAKTSSGLSLNDVQMVGPTIQRDILTLILKFRTYSYVLTADCEKMYRQVLISEKDRNYHRILWRSNTDMDIECFVLNTITYGTASASFLATRVLKELADIYQVEYPVASNVIRNHFYMDDLVTGADTIQELLKIKREVSFVLAQGGFNIRKWMSNETSIRSSVENKCLSFDKNPVQSTLGIVWNPVADILSYEIRDFNGSNSITKRTILSLASRVFDPLGLLAPIIIVAKLIMQKLWLLKLSWDESVPLSLQTSWYNFRDRLCEINKVKIPRHAIISSNCIIELHGFADASQMAYGACIYLRTINHSSKIQVTLICAKSKVAPVKNTATLPRLELCACVLLANLYHKVRSSLDINISETFLYSDSTIALSWIRAEPARWKTFVGNRVAEIQRLTESEEWYHISSEHNPADLVSRGVDPGTLEHSSLWWHGPSWLMTNVRDDWPYDKFNLPVSDIPETRASCLSLSSRENNFDVFNRFSSFGKLCRVIAYCFKFVSILKHKRRKQVISNSLTVEDLNYSTERLIFLAQKQAFQAEVNALTSNQPLPRKSKLLCLNPIIDEQNLLRVGGRLTNSQFEFSKIHPIILPNHHNISKLIASDEHRNLMHCGPQQLLFSLRERFWPLSGRTLARHIVHKCVVCARAKPKGLTQLMGSLPKERLTIAFPFQNSGVDYAGPFQLRDRKSRGFKVFKAYIAVFICFVTKAMHLELVTELTTDCFIAAFRRFIARRGKPSSIQSDNGTNFVGSNNKLRELSDFLRENVNRKVISDFATNEGIKWNFIPPRAPHFGGLWESGVRSVKSHLNKVLGSSLVTFEHFSTILYQIEAILNSRPLFPLSTDPRDLNPITPAHFLIGRSLTSLPDQPLNQVPEASLDAYQRLQKLVQSFWDRWRRDYICQLQVRTKWKAKCPSIKEGDMVVLKEENLHPCHWKLGRITTVHRGPDNLPRVVTVLCTNGQFKRPITKICPLPVN